MMVNELLDILNTIKSPESTKVALEIFSAYHNDYDLYTEDVTVDVGGDVFLLKGEE